MGTRMQKKKRHLSTFMLVPKRIHAFPSDSDKRSKALEILCVRSN